ncbi:MAG TPA: sigma-70 family RNA polymerase sigma factor [Streptosporangiaceae bacterium]|nr:sigma-70 family RNA polymerase sigma factor [Streptosporangiaceae bacterium]
MDVEDQLAGRFEASRPRLRAMAYRMLGSLSDADDAVQEGWLHAARGGADDVANLEGWFTTIVGRVCLDMLRSRKSRREEPLDPIDAAVAGYEQGPEQEAMLADSVGLALLVVLDTLPPAERVAFVLHDTFGLPFGEIASITGRSPAAARQLASRGRRRIQGTGPDTDPAAGARLARQRKLTEAFMAASRGGDLEGLISVLDPDVVLRSDAVASPSGVPLTVRGAAAVAGGARAASTRSRYGRVVLVNGVPSLIMAPRGRLLIALAFTFSGDKISQIDVIGDPDRLAALDLALLD